MFHKSNLDENKKLLVLILESIKSLTKYYTQSNF